ncbi:MAG: HAD-IIA family hydrolase [Candidatus Thorarchaeota archaeon]
MIRYQTEAPALRSLREGRLWLFDVDNTLIRDVEHPDAFPDALVFVRALLEGGRRVAALTNVGRLSSRQVHHTLTSAGFSLEPSSVFTAGSAAASYIRSRSPHARCFLISEGGATEDFIVAGLNVVNNPPIDYVAVGADRGLTFEKLNFAARMVAEGAQLICISGSKSYPGGYLGHEGLFMGEASIVAAIEHSTGRKAITVGKPMPEIFVECARSLGHAPQECVMVGDNPNSDVAGGRAAGMMTVLVDRGNDNIVEFDSRGLDRTPDLVVRTLDEVLQYL